MTNEKAIRKYVQILNDFQRVCTLEDVPASEIIISRCKHGEHWKKFNPQFEVYGFLNETQPKYSDFDHERAEANRVMEIEAIARGVQNEQNIISFIKQNNVTIDLAMQLDRHEYLSTILARSNNNLFKANEKMTEVKHMLSLEKEWALKDPNTELYQTSIRSNHQVISYLSFSSGQLI